MNICTSLTGPNHWSARSTTFYLIFQDHPLYT